jgi:hypothetical protein
MESVDVGQDNVVFMGRRSFRMELVGGHEDEVTIPKHASEIPTDKIFTPNRQSATRAALASLRAPSGLSRVAWLGFCSAAFVFGSALTLTVARRPAPRPVVQAAPVAAAPAIVIEPVPPAAPPALAPPPALALARRPAVKPAARPVRPHPVRPAPAAAPAATPWVDPFE